MFTLRNIILRTNHISHMRWSIVDRQSALDALERDDTLDNLFQEARERKDEITRFQNEPSPDDIKIYRSLTAFREILAKITTQNAADRESILDLISSVENTPGSGDRFARALWELQAEYAKKFADREKAEKAAVTPTKKETKWELSRMFEAVVQKNSREIQAKNFTEYLGKSLVEPAKTAFLDAFKKEESSSGITTYELTSISIPNLLRSIGEGTVYIADGAEWDDRSSVKKFLELYAKHKGDFDTALAPLIVATRAGQSVESVVKSGSLKSNPTNTDVIAYLTQIDNFQTFGTRGLDKQLGAGVALTLDSLKNNDAKFLDTINKALILGGSQTVGDMATLKSQLQSNPSVKFAILAGFREAARLPGGVNSLLDSKLASGIGENERTVLVAIDKDKVKLIDGLKSGFDKQLEKQIKDGTIKAEDAPKAQAAIDAYIADMKKAGSPGWDIVSKNFWAFITNRGMAAGAGTTMSLPENFLADNLNLGFGYSKNGGGFGVGVTFDKAITPDTKILYGWAGTPFIGMTSQFDRWSFTGIAWVGGGMIDVSRQMGNKDLEIRRMEAMKSGEAMLSQIEKMSNLANVKGVEFTADVSWFPEKSEDPLEVTRERAKKLHEVINTDIQNRLLIAGFEGEANPVVKSQMIYNALSQAVNARTNLLGLDDATGGWSLKSLGLALWSFSGVAFILPHFTVGRTSYTGSAHLERTQKTVDGKPVKVEWTTLFEAPNPNTDGTYALKLKKDSPLSFYETEVSLPQDAIFENGSIVGLKDYGIKVLRLSSGKYEITYDTSARVVKVPVLPATRIERSLERVLAIKEVLNNQKVRVQLSTLLSPWSKQNQQMNDWTSALDAYERTGVGNIADLKKRLLALLNSDTKYSGLTLLAKEVNNVTWEASIQSALFDIRWAAMMDVDQARRGTNFNKPHTPEQGERTTRKRWTDMLDQLDQLPQIQGITADDYNEVVPATYTMAGNQIGDIEEGMIGAVASLKTKDKIMTLMPAGTMRIANDGKENKFMKEMKDTSKKWAIFDTVLPDGSRSAKILQTNIATELKVAPDKVTYAHLRSLMVDKSAMIEGKAVNMKDTKFVLCAYGDCTNQWMGIIPGKISVDGKSEVKISASSISSETVESVNLRSASATTEVTLTWGVGLTRKPKVPGGDSTSTPGDTPVDPPSPDSTSLPGDGIQEPLPPSVPAPNPPTGSAVSGVADGTTSGGTVTGWRPRPGTSAPAPAPTPAPNPPSPWNTSGAVWPDGGTVRPGVRWGSVDIQAPGVPKRVIYQATNNLWADE